MTARHKVRCIDHAVRNTKHGTHLVPNTLPKGNMQHLHSPTLKSASSHLAVLHILNTLSGRTMHCILSAKFGVTALKLPKHPNEGLPKLLFHSSVSESCQIVVLLRSELYAVWKKSQAMKSSDKFQSS